jgi:hypothetical protein
MPEGSDRLREVDRAGFESRLANVEGLQGRELRAAHLDQVRQAVEQPGPVRAVDAPPGAVPHRRPRERDRFVDLGGAGLGHFDEPLLRHGIDDIERVFASVRPSTGEVRRGGDLACQLLCFHSRKRHVRLPFMLDDS